jgi:hypothetical protein
MERVHQLLAAGVLDDEDFFFWMQHWHHIASAKVPRETKIAAYQTLKDRGIANINTTYYTRQLYNMVRADRAFVAALDLDKHMLLRYRECITWIEDDVAALARYDPTIERAAHLRYSPSHTLMWTNAPRCIRFLLQDKGFREWVMREAMSPLTQQLAEELVQPTDQLDRVSLLVQGQSVKLIGMCVPDEELVHAWLVDLGGPRLVYCDYSSVPFLRKLHALATLDQRAEIKTKALWTISDGGSSYGCFELAWLCGLLGPAYPKVQECFLENNVPLFPAFTFAIIVAMCDGYLESKQQEITESQRRFFDVVMQLPMDLQALVSLRLWGRTSAVIRSETFDRAFLTII